MSRVLYLNMPEVDMRFNKEWNTWIPQVFEEYGHDVDVVNGPDFDFTLERNGFEDDSTVAFKLQELASIFVDYSLEDIDVVFVPHIEIPGLEVLEYYRRMNDLDFSIARVWHSGTYNSNHALTKEGCSRIGNLVETVMLDIADYVFVSSEYHKKIILENRIVSPQDIYATGLPIDLSEIQSYRRKAENREKIVVFPGRLERDKGYDRVKELDMDGYDVVCTQEEMFTKDEYFELLGKSEYVYMPARHETFGIAVMEGIAAGAKPVVPDGLVYPEFIPEKYRGLNFVEDTELPAYDIVEQFSHTNVIERWAELVSKG